MRAWVVALAAIWMTIPPPARAQAPEDVLARHGCIACHTLDGAAGPGPSFHGLFERPSRVRSAGASREVEVDDDYVRRSIREPDADLVEGHSPGAMPRLPLDDAGIEEVVTALHRLADHPVERSFETLWILAPSALLFLFAHLGLSFHPVRSRLLDAVGEKPFAGLYSLVVGLALVGIVVGWVYRPFVPIWDPPSFTRWVPLVVMPLAFYFLLAGYTTSNPSAAGHEATAERPPRGVLTITRHPALWGFALWGLAHLITNGDLASILLFGSIAALALAGMVHIDRRRARQQGQAWTRFAEQTSIVPLAAVLRGRTRLDPSGAWWRVLVALAVYGTMLGLHEWEFGVSPLPYGFP